MLQLEKESDWERYMLKINLAENLTGAQADVLSTEVVSSERFSQLDGAWRDLVPRAMIPNVFMGPDFVSAAGASREILVVLVWGRKEQDRRLEGVWALTRRKLRKFLPLPTLSAALNRQCALGSPVIRRDNPDPVFHAIFDAIAAEPTLVKAVCVRQFIVHKRMLDVLSRVLEARQSPLVTLRQRERPIIEKENDQSTFDSICKSSKRLSNLRRCRRNLSRKYETEEVSYREPEDVASALEDFLLLEASGWKGVRRTALACNTDTSNFARAWLTGLAVKGDVSIEALRVDGQPIGMSILAVCGDWAFLWKTCYDEQFSQFGPGGLNLEQVSRNILVNGRLKFVDSCAWDVSCLVGHYWKHVAEVVDVMFDVRRGGSKLTTAAARLDKGLGNCKRLLMFLCSRVKSWAGSKRYSLTTLARISTSDSR